MIKHLIRASLRERYLCPDCRRGTIAPHDRCSQCGLSWEDIEAAASFHDQPTKEKKK